jgi:hypothetical protein
MSPARNYRMSGADILNLPIADIANFVTQRSRQAAQLIVQTSSGVPCDDPFSGG